MTTDDVRLAQREGFESLEHLKRYTTLGMSIDQGRMGNVVGMALMAGTLGRELPEMGTTSFRPPYVPISLGALAGRSRERHFRPLRRTPLHDWALSMEGKMTESGWWQRPWWYRANGENLQDASLYEASTVRSTVGLCDVGTLGKIAVQGPDAPEFLDRVFVNNMAGHASGKARYGVMLRDDGIAMDDAVVWRLSKCEYFLTSTTVNAERVLAWLEELLQVRWPGLRVHLTQVTDQWAGCAVAGPRSRRVLQQCIADRNAVSAENLPFMGIAETRLADGSPCRLARVSFSGELAYEVYVPADFGAMLATSLWTAVESEGGCVYGLEALDILRIEKGHVSDGEIDGRTTMDDLGLGRMISTAKPCIGGVLRQRRELLRQSRPRLAGFIPVDREQSFNGGGILCRSGAGHGHGVGWITTSVYSPSLGHRIGLGFVQGGHEAWSDQSLVVLDPLRNQTTRVEAVAPCMYDPEGRRLHA